MTHHVSHAGFVARRTGGSVLAITLPAEASRWRSVLQAAALGGLLALGVVALTPAAAHAMTMQECSAKYKAAQAAGTLGGAKWNDFRKAQCGDGAAAASSAAPAAAAPAAAPAAQAPTKPAAQGNKARAPAATTGAAVFPRAISPKYSAEKPAKQRMRTCLDQYNANKAASADGNGGLKWIQKGGGYYSECNKRLKS